MMNAQPHGVVRSPAGDGNDHATALPSLTGHASDPATALPSLTEHANDLAPTLASLTGHASDPATALPSLTEHANDLAPTLASLTGHASDLAPARASLTEHATDPAPAFTSLTGRAKDPAPAPASLAGDARDPSAAFPASATVAPTSAEADEPTPDIDAVRAFDRLRPLRDALDPAEVSWPNIDITSAVGVALAAERRIATLLPEMEHLPGFDTRTVRQLRDLALAAGHAHAVFVRPGSPWTPKNRRARALHRELLAHAIALAGLGLIERPRVDAARWKKSNEALANSLISLSDLMLGEWRNIEHAGTLAKETLEEAYALGLELIEQLERRSRRRHDGHDAGEIRARAFTLLVRAYAQARRAVIYLRWDHGDADAIAPSLYRDRRGK
jgi:hypothetical protein